MLTVSVISPEALVFEGPADAVCRLVDWARTGPRQAAVDDVAVQPEPPEGLSAFRLRTRLPADAL